MMKTNFLGVELRNRFGIPSGTIATNDDGMRILFDRIPQLSFIVGKSTTIEPKEGNPEDIYIQLDPHSGHNAVGYTNPGIKEMVREIGELVETIPGGTTVIPQVGEGTPERFAYCVNEFDKIGKVRIIELNISCPHAVAGGILIGADPKVAGEVVRESKKATDKKLIVKVNAGVPNLIEVAQACIDNGADALSYINTLGGFNPELYNRFGGVSGKPIFPTTLKTAEQLHGKFGMPSIVMGGISDANDIRMLNEINNSFLYAIGTRLRGMTIDEKVMYFHTVERDLINGTNESENLFIKKDVKRYQNFVVKNIEVLSDTLRIIRFYENIDAQPGQYVHLKVDNEHSKPFSVANDENGLELLIKKVGPTTEKIFNLRENSIVRIKGPYGNTKKYNPQGKTVVYVGAGCGIAPIHHAAKHHKGKKIFIIGAKNKDELAYLDSFNDMGVIETATDDGSYGRHGTVVELLQRYLAENSVEDSIFLNCGPEIAMAKAHMIETKYTSLGNINYVVERYTKCSEAICGACTIPTGELCCTDGPIFNALEFTPGLYHRDKVGKKVMIQNNL